MATNNALKPTREKIFLAKLGKELTVNPISLEDDEWIEENIGQETLAAAMTPETINMNVVLKLLWRILDDESKKIVADVKILQWDNLIQKQIEYPTPEDKLKALVAGANEIMSIMGAIFKTRLKSNPEVPKNVKKKNLEDESLTSQNASTSSPPSTDTQSSNSTN